MREFCLVFVRVSVSSAISFFDLSRFERALRLTLFCFNGFRELGLPLEPPVRFFSPPVIGPANLHIKPLAASSALSHCMLKWHDAMVSDNTTVLVHAAPSAGLNGTRKQWKPSPSWREGEVDSFCDGLVGSPRTFGFPRSAVWSSCLAEDVCIFTHKPWLNSHQGLLARRPRWRVSTRGITQTNTGA